MEKYIQIKYYQKGVNIFLLDNVTFKEMLPRTERTLNSGEEGKEVQRKGRHSTEQWTFNLCKAKKKKIIKWKAQVIKYVIKV